MGTEGTICIFREAETVLGSWGKKGLKWHSAGVRALAEQLVQAFQLLAVRGCTGKKSGPLFKSSSHPKCKQSGHI